MRDRIPSARQVLEILGRDLSFESLRKEFPALTDDKLRKTLSGAALRMNDHDGPKETPDKPASPAGKWTAYIDGASRGNPGPAAAAAWINTPGGIIELKRFLGVCTNNAAEYEALILAMEAAAERGVENIEVRSDSELLVKQNKGLYRVKSRNLAGRLIRAKNLEKKFKSFTIMHIPREDNAEADRLANEAIDEALDSGE